MSQLNVVGKSKYKLADGSKWFANSGIIVGDVSVPATIELINIPNTGLRDAYVKILPFYGKVVSTTAGNGLGIIVKINDIEVVKIQDYNFQLGSQVSFIELFIPYQSKLEIISLNASANNTQERGVSVLGWFFG